MTHTLFAGHRRIISAGRGDVAVAWAQAARSNETAPLLAFDDCTGRQVDFDVRGTDDEIRARYRDHVPESTAETVDDPSPVRRGPGRPRLGVVPREITLLPHHWEWLAAQPGGASVTLRKLVEAARKLGAADEHRRAAREAAYHFLHAIAGDLPEYEEVTRALFAGDLVRMRDLMHDWPADVRDHAIALAGGA